MTIIFIIVAISLVAFGIIQYFLDAYLILRLREIDTTEYDAAGKPLQLIFINNPFRSLDFAEYIWTEQYRRLKDKSLVRKFNIARRLLKIKLIVFILGILSFLAAMFYQILKDC